MLKILERYIVKTVLLATGLAALIICGVLFVMLLLGELKSIGHGDYGMSEALLYVLLRLPNELYQFSPMLILLGSIMGLSILSSYRELAVMRTAGFSIRRISLCVLGAAFILIAVISLAGELIAPPLSFMAETHKASAKNGGQAVVTASGVWFHVDNNFIHVENVVGHDLLEGVTRYQFDNNHHLLAAYYADSLTNDNNNWMMNEVVVTTFYHDRTKSQSFPQLEWDLKFNANLLSVGLVDPYEMSLPKLAKFANYLEKNGLQSGEYRYDYWRRIFQPLASLVMILLAIPFVLGALSASTLGWRIIVGIMAGFVFFISNAFLGQLCIVYQIPAMLAALSPIVLFFAFGMLLSKGLIRR